MKSIQLNVYICVCVYIPSHLLAGIHHASAASIGGNSSGGRGLGVGDNSSSVDQTESAQLP